VFYCDKICLKFASHDFLLYAVYVCQKSLNFIYAFKCYQQIAINVGLSWPHFSWPTLYITDINASGTLDTCSISNACQCMSLPRAGDQTIYHSAQVVDQQCTNLLIF